MSAINSPTGLNLATALMVMAHTAAEPESVMVPTETVRDLRRWVSHWQADAAANLPPTPESLAHVAGLLSALERKVS